MKEISFLNRYLPDYAGFVFAKSRRQVTPAQAVELGTELLPAVKRVGVFVDCGVKMIADIVETTGFDAVQLHGGEDCHYIELLRSLLKPGIEIWKALRMDESRMPEPGLLKSKHVDRLLLDTYAESAYGGTGKCFEWSLVSQLDTALPIVLAGGLRPDNVRRAIEQASPFAVDTSSGVEREGVKDDQKMYAFIKAVRGGIVC